MVVLVCMSRVRETAALEGGRAHRQRPGLRTWLIALFTRLTHFDFSAPFGFEDLGGGDTPTRIRVQDGVDHVPAACLKMYALAIDP